MHSGASSTMVNDHGAQERAGKTTPRIKTGNCSISTTTSANAHALSAAASGATDSAIYDKQMAWKLHGQRKTNTVTRKSFGSIGKAVDRVASQADAASSHMDADADRTEDEDCATGATTARIAAVHPTESQESSIQLHLVRQERAREHAMEAQQRKETHNGESIVLKSSSRRQKDFTKVTAFEPFQLSVGNQKPRSSSASPTKRAAYAASQSITEPLERRKVTKVTARAVSSSHASSANQQHISNNNNSNNATAQQQQPPAEIKEDAWDKERSSLISIIDAQRRELELREKAQHEALCVAENFATAIQAFEERLLVVEQSTSHELTGIRELLQRQSAATDLILQSLGITQPPPPSSSSLESTPSGSSSSSSAAQSLARRETK